jgi:signal transduction histidine kinase
MLNELPIQVTDYLLNKINPFTGLLILRLNNKGVIDKWKGNPKDYLCNEIKKGVRVDELIPALTGLIPFDSESIKLTRLQLKDDKYTDVHIVKDNGNYWIIFVDQTKEVDKLKDLLQNMNERELHEKDAYENPFKNVDRLNFATFRKEKQNGFCLLPNVPEWLKKHPLYNTKTNELDPVKAFPFLEVFFVEIGNFWKDYEENYIVSETWSETFGGKDHYMRAFAVNFNEENYLFIKSFIREGVEEQNLLQAFRDSALAFDKLAKAEKKLKELLVYKNKFNSIISHDLRAPIAAVLGVVDLISSDEDELNKLNEGYRELLLSIKDEMLRLLDYNDKLYHWANLELGNFNLEIQEVSVSEIFEIAGNTAKGKCDEKNIKLQVEIAEDKIIKVDKTLFLQVLNNLLSNAVKFTPEGNDITLSEVVNGGKLFINVHDTGIGMKEDVVKNLFEDSLRGTTVGTSGEKGTGLGLGIIKKVVDAHGFAITASSKPGKGTTFSIEIPGTSVV